jgi:hypothetical protein
MWAIPILLLLALGAGVLFLQATAPRDSEAIRMALRASIEASREGRPGGVLEKLSFQFRINDESPGTMFDIAKFVREQKPDVTIPEPSDDAIVVTGDEAQLTTPVKVKMPMMDLDLDEVTIRFRKEQSLAYFFLPVKVWKVHSVSVPEGSIPSMGWP